MSAQATLSLIGILRGVWVRDVRLAWAQGGTGTMVVSFFMIAVALFPFGIGPAPQILVRIAPGILLVVALLATLISLDRLFQADYEDGTLEQLALSPMGLAGIVFAKITAHWCATLLPLILVSPVMAALLGLDSETYPLLVVTFFIGTPALSLIGAVGAALTVALRRGGVLLSLLVLPLYIPTLIFAASALDAAVLGQDATPHLALLGAITLISGLVALPACVAGLKIALE